MVVSAAQWDGVTPWHRRCHPLAAGLGFPPGLYPSDTLCSLQTKALIDKLQKLVSSEGRFKNLREALKK